jgi:putative membrane protein
VLRPILIILTLPITIITLGLFTFIINGFLFWFVGTIVKGFEVQGFFTALLGALIMTLVNALIPSNKEIR